MSDYPKRPQQHVLDSAASKYLERYIPDEWVSESIKNDYGLDYTIGIVKDEDVLGPNFSIQLKGQAKSIGTEEAKVQVKKSTVNYWNGRFEPTLIVIYCKKDDQAYYKWFDKNDFDLLSPQKTYTITISKNSKIQSIDWNYVQDEVIKLFSIKHDLYHIYGLALSKLNNNEFSHIWSSYTKGRFEETIQYCKIKLQEENKLIWHVIISHAYYAIYRYRHGYYHNQIAFSTLQSEEDLNLHNQIFHVPKVNGASILAELGRTTGNKMYLLKAFDLWSELLASSSDSTLLYNFGNTCLLLKKYDLAKEHYLGSLKIYPDYAEAWTNLADVYGAQMDFGKELGCYMKALIINSNLKNAQIGEAIAFYHCKLYTKALEKFLELHDSDKEWRIHYSDFYYYLSEVYSKLNKVDLAMSTAEDGYYYDPGNIKILNKLSSLYEENWKHSLEIKEKAKNLFELRLEAYSEEFRSMRVILEIMESENSTIQEMSNYIARYFRIEGSDEEIIDAFLNKK